MVRDAVGRLISSAADSFGDIVEEMHYNASGSVETAGQTGFVTVAFAFTGRYFDSNTGLQNSLNRWYDAIVERWLSADPIGFAGQFYTLKQSNSEIVNERFNT